MFLNYINAFLKFGTMSRGFLKCPEISVAFVIRPFLLIEYYVYSTFKLRHISKSPDEILRT